MKWSMRGCLAATLALALGSGCVPESAGYGDVKKLTAARLDAHATWNAVDARPQKEVEELLTKPLTAELAAKIAVLNNPRLQADFEKLGIARAAWVSALQVPNPTLGGALVYGIDESPEVDIDAAINLTGLLLLPSRSGIASARVEAAVQDVAGDVISIAFEAKRTFIDYQMARAELALRETITQSWAASSEMAKRLFAVGNVPELRSVNEKAFYEETRIQQATAEARVKATREAVNGVLGLWGKAGARWTASSEPLPVPGSYAEVRDAFVDVEARAIERSLGIQAARLRYEAFARQANLTRLAGWVPEVHAGVRVARQQEDGEPARWGAGPLVELGVPLFYQSQGETAGALAEVRRQAKLIEDTAIRTRSNARAAFARILTSAQTAEHYRNVILPLRGQVVEQTQLQYNAMSVGVFELLQAKNLEIAAHLAYLDVVREFWNVQLELEQLLAGGLTDASTSAPSASPALVSGGGSPHD